MNMLKKLPSDEYLDLDQIERCEKPYRCDGETVTSMTVHLKSGKTATFDGDDAEFVLKQLELMTTESVTITGRDLSDWPVMNYRVDGKDI